ncbi:hypothetical protein [Lewinella cohaerens]|uniref:hypothetical protein n=1 Tax=Lewinella cohaerens TaxID=70995 RepID=UPI00037CB6AB|nr:hypothetical protein [Lewinella cohaerens]
MKNSNDKLFKQFEGKKLDTILVSSTFGGCHTKGGTFDDDGCTQHWIDRDGETISHTEDYGSSND